MRSAHVLMGNGSLMEVEGGWKWKVDESGSLMEVVVDGPNEPPYQYDCRFWPYSIQCIQTETTTTIIIIIYSHHRQ